MSLRRESSKPECAEDPTSGLVSRQASSSSVECSGLAATENYAPSPTKMPSRQENSSTGAVSAGVNSPTASIHSVNSNASFSVGTYRFSYCPICFEQFSVQNPAMVLPCNHVFHAQCHLAWRDRSASCAVCSTVIDDANVRMMHTADLHAHKGKGPLPTIPPSPLKKSVVHKKQPCATACSVHDVVPQRTVPVMVPPDEEDGVADTEQGCFRSGTRSNGSRGGIAAGVDEFVYSLQRAFSCFRCGKRGRGAATGQPQPAARRETAVRHDAAEAAVSGHSAALHYEEQERRMQEQKHRANR